MIQWDGKTIGEWTKAIDGASAVINLSGKTISCKWTPRNRQLITDSRIESTTVIGHAIDLAQSPPPVWINASAIGFYGSQNEPELDESSPKGQGFLADLCENWEQALHTSSTPQTRKIALRMGVILGRDGGAFPVLARLCRLFMGGHVGSGTQMVSWIHIDDLIRLMLWLIDGRLDGAINATAPRPVSNAELMATLAHMMNRPSWPPVPAFAVKLAGALGGPPPSLTLDGQNVIPWRAMEAGFPFLYGDIHQAIRDLLIDV
jgi:uncharacterized protein (TIGR01777 family)